MKEKLKKQKGITLVALVITIIVLLILAMVSISIVMNQGIMTKSKDAVDHYNQKAEEEQGELTFFERLLGKYNGEKVLPEWWDEVESTTNSDREYWELTDEEKTEITAAGMHEESEGTDEEGNLIKIDTYFVVKYESEEKDIYMYVDELPSNTKTFKQYNIYNINKVSNSEDIYLNINDETIIEGVQANNWYYADNVAEAYVKYNGEFPIDISEIPEEAIYSKTYLKRLVENFNK